MGLKFSFEYKINGVQKSSCSEINDDFILDIVNAFAMERVIDQFVVNDREYSEHPPVPLA